MCIFIVVGFVVETVNYEVYFGEADTSRIIFQDDLHHSMRSVTAFFTLLASKSFHLVICIIMSHKTKLDWQQHLFRTNRYNPHAFTSEFKEKMIKYQTRIVTRSLFIHIFICIVQPIPFLDFQVDIREYDSEIKSYVYVQFLFSDLLYAMMFFRAYLVIRTISNYSMFTNYNANVVCNNYGFNPSMGFNFKSNIILHPV